MQNYRMRVVKLAASCAAALVCGGLWAGYVTDGLVLHYDAIDNAGTGVHSGSPTVWKDLSGNGHDLTLPTSGLTVGADEMTFDRAVGEVSNVECLAEDSDTTDFTLEVVFAASGSFDGALNSARSVAANPRISLYLRSVGSTGLVGGYYYNGGKRYFAGAPTRCCEWNNTQFIRRFHTYSLRTKAGGGSVAVDGSDYAKLQDSFYNDAATATSQFTVGCSKEIYRIKSVRLYNRQLTAAEAAMNAAVDEARFALKPVDENGNANAFEDAAFYFRGARQALDTFLDDCEFANALYVGSAAYPVGDKFTVGGSRANIAVETIDVPAPYAGKILKNRSVVHFKQPLSADDTTKASTSNIILTQPVAATNKASYTVMLRFKVESRVNPDPEATDKIQILQLGYGWSANSGLDLQLCGPAENLYVRAYHGSIADDFKDMQNDPDKTLKIGEWVDMALTVNGNKNVLYYKTESGKWYEGSQNRDVGLTGSTSELYKLAIGGPIKTKNNDVIFIGTSVDVSVTPAFRGWYQQVVIWDRALTRDEVLNAFCDGCSEGDEWKVGVANDMSLEFAGNDAANIGTVNDWRNMTNELSSVDSAVSVNFALVEDMFAKTRTFKFKTTSFSASGTFDLSVNGRTVAEDVPSTAGQSASVTLSGSFFVPGANTLTVTRSDSNTGKMYIDCMSLVVAEGDVPVSSAVAGDPLSGAYRWFRDDGSVFRDVLRTAYPNSSSHAWTKRGPSDNIVRSKVSVTCPYRGMTLPEEDCIYFKQETKMESGKLYGKYGGMYTSIFPITNALAHTSFIRFKIDSFQNPTNISASIYGTGYDWTNGRGMAFILRGDDAENLYIVLGLGRTTLHIKNTQNGEVKNRIAQGKWIDVAVVVKDAVAEVYACVEGGDFQYLGRHNGGAPASAEPDSKSSIHIGTSSGASSENWSTEKVEQFRGWVHQAAVWPYALSEKEVRAVFGFPSPEVARIGVENGSSAEFSGSGETSYAYPKNADFRDAPSMIAASGSLTLTFDLADRDVRGQLLKLAATANSAPATFAVSVNGTRITNYTEQYEPFNEYSVVPGGSTAVGVQSRYLRVGENTVTLTRIDADAGAFELDALSFGNGDGVHVRTSGFTVTLR